ncbi:MAG: signal peptide peptidase SppA [Oscillatoria sp. PMC 1051.18]|nr:signal peptide peptidase SppA [Oscillatoria sp. PMC 1050.18]MEC5030269.1 signal peptide peptidase SppA [Oscillatoria sp. PMC 1051.18]
MRQFIQQTFASIIGTLAGLILFATLGISGLVLLIVSASLEAEGPNVKDKSVLVFDLSTQIADTEPPATFTEAIAGEAAATIALREVLEAIEKATEDDRIIAIFLDGSGEGGGSGYATLREVRTALQEFQDAGKEIIAYDVDFSEKEYYVASIADTVVLNPMGAMELNGLSSEQLFLAGALDRYGIGVQVVRVGNYKAAVEPFIRQELSPENRQQTQALLADLWQEFVGTVGESRELKPQELQAIANTKGLLLPEEAQQQGLVDRVAYFDEVVADLKELTEAKEKDKSFKQIRLENYGDVALRNSRDRSSENKIAVVYAEGAIVTGQGGVQQVGSDRFAQELRKLRRDEDVKAVVLRVNSPGGSATASDIILRELKLIKDEKPLIVSMGDVAASGGYWIATAASQIFAEPNTITGSIGVFGLLPNVEELANENGITWDVVRTNNLANLDTIARPKTEAELAIYQRFVNQVYNQFLNLVAEARNLPPERVAQIAQGRVWSGEDAKQIGLVDQIGGIDAAINYAAEEAKLGDDWEVQEYPYIQSFEERLVKKLTGSSIKQENVDPLTKEFRKLKQDLAILQSLNDPRGIYTLLPFDLRIK